MLRTEKLPVFQVQVPHPLPSEFLDCSSKAPSPSRHPGPGATSKNHFSPETCLTTDQGSRTKCIPRLTLGPPEHLPCTHLPRSQEKKKKKILRRLSQLWNLRSTHPCISQAAWSAFTGLLQSLGLLAWALEQQGHSHGPATVVVFQLLGNIRLFVIPWTAAY